MTDGFKFNVKNMDEFLREFKRREQFIEVAGQYGITQVAFAVEAQAKQNAMTGTHPRGQGHIPGTGPGPNRVTGNLLRSIHTAPIVKGFGGRYTASVFPTMIYSRAVELGNPRWKSGVKYPYLTPAADKIRPLANRIFTAAFNQKWSG